MQPQYTDTRSIRKVLCCKTLLTLLTKLLVVPRKDFLTLLNDIGPKILYGYSPLSTSELTLKSRIERMTRSPILSEGEYY